MSPTAITTAAVAPRASAALGAETGVEMGRTGIKGNALEKWQELEEMMEDKLVIVFLDYDGTLSNIVSEPEKAYMTEDMRTVLADVSNHFTTAIVTGRSKEKVYDFVKLDEVFYAGSHGFEIQGPSEIPINCKVAENIRPALLEAQTDLSRDLDHIGGLEIEDNKYSMSVHYRNVESDSVDEVHSVVHKYADARPEVIVKHGKKVLELRPKVDWNKGSAVLWIMEALSLDKREDVISLYLGDDVTDEDAFKVLKAEPDFQRARAQAAAAAGVGDSAAAERRGEGEGGGGGGGGGVNAVTGEEKAGGCGGVGQQQQQSPLKAAEVCTRGIGILVSPSDPERFSNDTYAQFSLDDPTQVKQFLEVMVQRASSPSGKFHKKVQAHVLAQRQPSPLKGRGGVEGKGGGGGSSISTSSTSSTEGTEDTVSMSISNSSCSREGAA